MKYSAKYMAAARRRRATAAYIARANAASITFFMALGMPHARAVLEVCGPINCSSLHEQLSAACRRPFEGDIE